MMGPTLLLTAAVLALCFVGLGFNILFRKNGKFPDKEISHHPELRKRGLRCASEEARIEWMQDRKRSVRPQAGEPPACEAGCEGCLAACTQNPSAQSK